MNTQQPGERPGVSREPQVRITNNAFTTLALSMIGFGTAIGLGFPFVVQAAGVPATAAFSPGFFAFTVAAGVLVGGVNILLARLLVRPRLKLMARRMKEVEEGLKEATYTGDWSRCDPDDCALPVESEDEFGAAAVAFNRLLFALAESHKVEARIADFTSAMSAELHVEPICRAAIECFRRDLGAIGVAIVGNAGGSLEVLASHGLTDPDRLTESDMVRNSIRSLEVDSVTMPEHLLIDAGIARLKPQHVIVYPLVLESTAIGAVVLASSGEIAPGAQALGPLFIKTLSVALSNAQSHESIRRIASVDGLTGMLNRREGLLRLEQAFTRGGRLGEPLGVIMLDIDHFKRVNDVHGHLAGDAVLGEMSRVVTGVLRREDFLVRYGGEEFLVVLPGAGARDIELIAERIRAAAEGRVMVQEDAEVRVTVSAGYATTDALGADDAMDLVARADAALLVAKRTGRNRVVSAAA